MHHNHGLIGLEQEGGLKTDTRRSREECGPTLAISSAFTQYDPVTRLYSSYSSFTKSCLETSDSLLCRAIDTVAGYLIIEALPLNSGHIQHM